ncbi:MAG: GNAT family N-acetyltransferase [Chloroflexi bacterium]|nr:GNAT family N-acetyltransferase [Chloroflexota bacterium]
MNTIRKATPTDAAGIARVHVDSWRTTYRGIVADEFLQGLSMERRERMWRETLATPDSQSSVYVAEEAGQIVGFVNCMAERESDPHYTGEVGGIYLLEQAQGQGTGRRLMQTAAGELLRGGHSSMLLWVLKDNLPARKFYEVLGGKYLREKPIEIGAQSLLEVAYGWDDLIMLAKE